MCWPGCAQPVCLQWVPTVGCKHISPTPCKLLRWSCNNVTYHCGTSHTLHLTSVLYVPACRLASSQRPATLTRLCLPTTHGRSCAGGMLKRSRASTASLSCRGLRQRSCGSSESVQQSSMGRYVYLLHAGCCVCRCQQRVCSAITVACITIPQLRGLCAAWPGGWRAGWLAG